MELTEPTTELLIVALGNTHPVKEELKSLGFRWNAANKVWYRLGEVTDLHCEFLMSLRDANSSLGIYFRTFVHGHKGWSEIEY